MLNRRTLLAAGGVSIVLSPQPVLAQRHGWPHGARAAVSLTYDDGLDSQLENAVPALDSRGFKATFFLTKENMEARVAQWRAVADEGHEIGDHTVSHPCHLAHYSAARFKRQEIDKAERFLNANFGVDRQRTFAFPCGVIDMGRGPQLQTQLRYISTLRGDFLAARATDGDPNDPRLVSRDRYVLQAMAPTYDHDDPRIAIAYMKKALRWGFWAILIFHDILPRRKGDGDTSIAHHDLILDWIRTQPLWCAPMRDVLRDLGVRTT